MVKYLQMDGVDDKLQLPSMTFTEIRIDAVVTQAANAVNHYFLDARIGITAYVIFSGTGAYSIAGFTVYENDVSKSGTSTVTTNVRTIYKFTRVAATDDIMIFGRYTGTELLKGNIYDIKIYNGATMQAHYDMSTGTAQDQSGNGNHATLTGGTFVDDGTGGGDTGTDGSITLDLTQQIYNDSSVNLSLSQQIYADISANLNLIQAIYKDTEAVLNLTQAIYQDLSSELNLRQEIYAEAESILNLIQEFYEDSQTYITLQLIQQVYKDSSAELSLTQAVYQDSEIGLPLRQEMYENKESNLNLTQNVYKDDMSVLTLSQSIYKDSFSTLNTVQQMYVDAEISLPLLIQIRDDLVNLIGIIRLVGKRVLNVPLQGKRELNVTLKGGIDVTVINQNFSMIAGDTKNLVITIPEDLTGCTVKWGLRQRQYSTENFISKSTSDGISINGTEITIKLAPADTQALGGTYFHECEVTDQLNNVSTIFTGMCTISRSGV
jgi:hypothetical protein